LLGANTGVNKSQSLAILDQKTTHRHIDQVAAVGRVCLLPNAFRNDTEHGAAVEFKMTGFYRVKFHALKVQPLMQ